MGSGNSAMKFAPLYVLLWAAPNLVAAQSEVICPEGKSKTTKSLGLDEYVDYKTQDGAPGTDYTNGVNCNVLFKRKKGSDCELKFNCTHFDLKSAKPAPKCQDKIIISKKKYCQTTGPDVTVSGSKLKVAFKTNKKGTATGAVCTAYCVPPPPPPASCGAIITRRNVMDLNNAEFEEYSKRLGKVKSVQNSTGFKSIGQYHGEPYFCNADQTKYPANYTQNGCCINHWGQDDRIDLFTPWHRLYMANMEYAFRLPSPNKPLAIPYWDWTNSTIPGLPLLANYGQWKNGPILGKLGATAGVTSRDTTPIPYEELQQWVKTSYMQKTFCEFNFHIVQPHNTIHVKVGGDMGYPQNSSYDPIFYLHHSYVDSQYAYFQELQKN